MSKIIQMDITSFLNAPVCSQKLDAPHQLVNRLKKQDKLSKKNVYLNHFDSEIFAQILLTEPFIIGTVQQSSNRTALKKEHRHFKISLKAV